MIDTLTGFKYISEKAFVDGGKKETITLPESNVLKCQVMERVEEVL